MFKLILVLSIISIHFTLRTENESNAEDTLSPIYKESCTFGEGCCPKFDHCHSYQVTPDLNDYGCSLCESEYLQVADINYSGRCIEKNPFANCMASQSAPLGNNGIPHCWACEANYILADLYTCIPKISNFIDNCSSYRKMPTGVVTCRICNTGYTLNQLGVCEKTCDIENCDNCVINGGVKYCKICEKGFIGVFYSNVFAYSKCLSCNDWHKELITK
jgi:hypothetical protein